MTTMVITSFDGVTLNGISGYKVFIPASADWAREVALDLRERANGRTPQRDGSRIPPNRFPFVVYNEGNLDLDVFRANVEQWFSPWGGPRILLATHPDGATALKLTVDVERFRPRPNTTTFYDGTFVAADYPWRGTAEQSSTSSPITGGGTFRALPRIVLTPKTTTVMRRRVTVTDGGTYGLMGYPVRITFDSTGVSATTSANYLVYAKGRSVPFRLTTPNDASSKLDVVLDVEPGGEAEIDIYYGSSISNSVTADALPMGGLDYDNGSYSATNAVWDRWDCSLHPGGMCLQWKPAKLDLVKATSATFGITAESSSSITISMGAGYPNDVNALICTIGCKAGTTNALSDISRDPALSAGSGRYRVMKRVAGQLNWTQVFSNAVMTTADTGALDIDDAVQVAIVLEALSDDAEGEVVISGTGQLALAGTPSVSVGSATTARLLDGVITNTTTGATLTFEDVLCDDVAFTVDCDAETAYPASGPWYGSITPATPVADQQDLWLPLRPGSNAWSNTLDADAEFFWQPRYLI